MSNFALPYGSGMMLKTHTPTYEFTFKWTIEGFSKLSEEWNEKCPEFSIEPKSNWYVEFDYQKKTFLVYICREQDTNFSMSYDLNIADCNHKTLHTETGSANGTIDEDAVQDVDEDTMEILNNTPNDQILITITIKVKKNSPDTVKLSRELKHLLDPTLKTDLTLTIKGESVACHKDILAAKSPVFAKMFEKELTDENSSTLQVDDFSLSTVEAVLSFMYSVEMFDFDTALEVYAAAAKYEIADLKDICGRILISKVTMETVPKVLYIANIHEDSFLKDRIMRFITLHYKPNGKEVTLKS